MRKWEAEESQSLQDSAKATRPRLEHRAEPSLSALIAEVPTEQHQALEATLRMISEIPSIIPF